MADFKPLAYILYVYNMQYYSVLCSFCSLCQHVVWTIKLRQSLCIYMH